MNYFQGNNKIIKVEIDFLKKILIVELDNGKKYFKEIDNLENFEEKMKEVARQGKKLTS